ncbi:MAG: hypothetical protein E7318_07810 [Clostridiales bacterium]|nr:hypothetical protein [Clostridiales bacterium]
MKYIAILSVLVLIAALVGVGYMYMTANITVDTVSVVAMEAANQPVHFAELRQQLRLGAVLGTPFVQAQELADAENYQFLTYTVRLKNGTAVTADMVELQVTPMAGDILQIGSYHDVKLPAGQTVDATATILTDKNMHAIREVTITYYIWGVPFTMKTTVR